MTLLVLSCSISWCQNDTIFPTGERSQDSVLIAVDAIKKANVKLIELKYEIEINRNLVKNDSILRDIINSLHANMAANEIKYKEDIRKVKTQRNIGFGTSGVLLILLIIAIL